MAIGSMENSNQSSKLEELKSELQQLKSERKYNQQKQCEWTQQRNTHLSKITKLLSESFSEKNKPKPYTEPAWFILLSLGLCFVLFLGINELVGISFRNAQILQLPLFFFNFIVAFAAALATKKVMVLAASHSHHPQKIDRDSSSKSLAWWVKLSKGNGAFYLGLFFIALETVFGLPGLLGLLSPSLADNPLFILAIFAGGAFFAAVNVSLGYWVGINEAVAEARKEEYDNKLRSLETDEVKLREENAIYNEKIGKCEPQIKYYENQIEELDREIELITKKIKLQTIRDEDQQAPTVWSEIDSYPSNHSSSSNNDSIQIEPENT
jgi:hypothetical protein